MMDVTTGHIARSYDKELARLRSMVLDMGTYVCTQARDAGSALLSGDINLARRTIERERKVDYAELDADDAIFNLIAKRQPAAIDLRFIIALSKVVGNLERAGDKAEQIAWCAVRLLDREGQQASNKLLHHVRLLHGVTVSMLERSMTALAEADVDMALDVFEDDQRVEEELDAAMRHLMTFIFENTSMLGQVLDMSVTLRALRGLAENAGNIAEQVIFIAKGRDVRYQNREILIEALRSRDQH